jgi:hypothetical protein
LSTTPSYVLPAAAAALAHAAGSTIRDDGAAQSLVPLMPQAYKPARSCWGLKRTIGYCASIRRCGSTAVGTRYAHWYPNGTAPAILERYTGVLK